jgi:putative sugar O-methyltransferase
MGVPTGKLSPLWESFIKDFRSNEGFFRAYGLNHSVTNDQVRRFWKAARVLNSASRLIRAVLDRFTGRALRLLSTVLLGRSDSAALFGLGQYTSVDYDKHLLNSYETELSPYGLYFSHNTLKSFSYVRRLAPFLEGKTAGPLRVLEIGAGLFNFGHLLSLRVDSFTYVVVDLPSMIDRVVEKVLAYPGKSYEVFTETSLEDFWSSTADRRVLFIPSNRLIELRGVLSFDLFVNHESFAEMPLPVVNDYLEHVKALLRPEALVFLVNRVSRIQALGKRVSIRPEAITDFFLYDLSAITPISIDLDQFRMRETSSSLDAQNISFVGVYRPQTP